MTIHTTTTATPTISSIPHDTGGAAVASGATPAAPDRHLEVDWFTRHVFNPIVSRLTRWGVSLYGSRILAVAGRTSGEMRTVPVNPLTIDGQRYLVAPRGVTQWVRNLRVAGRCELRLGRRIEHVEAVEVRDADKPEILRAYLAKWKWEVGKFFDGLGPDASDEELLAAASKHPIFVVTPADVPGQDLGAR
ncbi:MAG: nitroreductase/quinone reductase family protein [Ilumatobacteraceae bacterium]